MSPSSHDPFAPSGPRRSGLLPAAFEEGARSAGATDAELAAIRDHWWKGTNDQRAEAEELIGDLSDAEWAEFIDGWRRAMEDPDFSPWNDGLDEVRVHVELPDGTTLEDAVAEIIDLGAAPDGMVGAGWHRPDGEVDGVPMSVGMRGWVPIDGKEAVAFIGDGPDDEAEGRARLVLAAELDRPAAGRRKKVLAACVAVLGDAEVAEQTTAAGEGLGG